MDTVALILVLALIATALFLWGIKEYLYKSYSDYETKSVEQIQAGLADNLLFMDPQKLFILTLGATAIAGVIVYFIYGVVVAAIAMIGVALTPRLLLKFLKKKRDERFIYQLPDCLSAIAMSLRAGSNLSRAMEIIVDQQPAPISQEFAIVVSDVRMGKQVDDALEGMYRRVEAIEVELFTSAVAISRSVGGNLANTVETLAETIRERLKVEGKIKALTAMGKIQGLVLGMVPLLVIIALFRIEADAMALMSTKPLGWVLIALLFVMAVIAFFVVRKIINIDI